MKKSVKHEKFDAAYKGIDFGRLIEDLHSVEGFTDQALAEALKKQKKISVHVNGAFYRNLLEPFIGALRNKNLVEVKKIGGTRFYTIFDRQAAINAFSKSKKEKTKGQSPYEIPVPILQQPKVVGKIDLERAEKHGIGSFVEKPEVKTLGLPSKSKSEKMVIKPTKKNKTLIRVWMLIFGLMSKLNKNRVASREVTKLIISFFGKRVQLKEPRGIFNTLSQKFGEEFRIQSSGKTVSNVLFLSGGDPEAAFDFVSRLAEENNFLKDNEFKKIVSWKEGKDVDQVHEEICETTPEREEICETTPEQEEICETSTKKEEVPLKEEQTTLTNKLSTFWVITKMDLREFSNRYGLLADEIMKSDDKWLLEAIIDPNDSDKNVLDRIISELREGERILGV